ncbi:hypothetical protein ATE84_3819 [Aquimarina sp. MAR_2010_214]|uniref:hypothetical protein n=1 Tax=Aquimarina sp. MAR_2010_214 TaxID=1250026 RepID=UPI000CC0CC90|nr:hypothetical protein [Aquimarina sp. MAR_2010_214]PKV51721.1 hypothetical protein ATE84_3819 [Aquimarina sp. MAR_2010_214]
MKNVIILFGMLLILCTVSSCEKQEINDEISETEVQLTDPGDDGTIDPGDDDEY